MPAKSRNRKILLVGSVPLANAKEVFSESAARLGELIPRIPDGETGVRTMWILCQKEVMANTKNLKMHHQFDIAPGVAQIVYEVADPSQPVEFPALNYAAAAKDSYRQFTELKKAGKIAATTKFQVSLPTAVAVLSGFIVPESQALVEKPYTASTEEGSRRNRASDPPSRASDTMGRCPRSALLSRLATRDFRRSVEEGIAQKDRRSRKRGPVRHRSRIPSLLRRSWAQASGGAKRSWPFSRVGECHSRAQQSPDTVDSHAGAAGPKGRRIFRAAEEATTTPNDRALSRTRSSHRWRRGGAFAGGNCEAAYARIRRCVRMRLRSP